MNYFLITTIIFFVLFIVTLILFIPYLRKSSSRINELEFANSRLKENSIQIEARQKELEELLELATDSVPDGILLLDKDLKIVKLNLSLANIFHLDRPKTIGEKTIFVFNNRNLEELIDNALSTGTSSRSDIVFYGDEEINFNIDAIPLGTTNYRLMLLFNNITQEVDFSRLRSQFVANVSHEMRTPLTSIKGYIETLLDNNGADLDSKKMEISAKYLEKTLSEVERLNVLIEDVLNLANIEYRRNILFKQEYNIVDIISECIDSLKFLAEKNNVEIAFIYKDDVVLFQTEEHLFTQVVRNLIENTVFHAGSHVKLKITLEENDTGINLIFEDNGMGIDSEDLPYIFQRFFRGKKSRISTVTGSGLGLSIVKHIVELHGGRVEVSSQPGVITRFALSFPKQ